MQISFNHPPSSPVSLSPKAFLLETRRSRVCTARSDKRESKKMWWVYRRCASVIAFQFMLCLSLEMVGIWDTFVCNAIFKGILHNSSFFLCFFFLFSSCRAILKVSLADPFNLTSLWSQSAKSWLLGFATSRGMGGYWDDNEALFSKEWMN